MDPSHSRREKKVRWLASELRSDLLRGLDERQGWPALVQVKVSGAWVPVAMHMSLVIDAGEGRSGPDECRIESRPGASIEAPTGYAPVVVGVLGGEPPPRTIVLWDAAQKVGRGTRVSLYSKWSAIRLANDKGWYEHENSIG